MRRKEGIMGTATNGRAKVTELAPVSNGGEQAVEAARPYRVIIEVQGMADLLLHGWNIEAVEGKAKAAKGSREKKSDNLESYVYRDDKGRLCLPGDTLRAAMAEAARYEQDPRSPRKSMRDLVKAGLIPLNPLAPLGVKEWDYVARHRVVVQRAAITRSRPALRTGWVCEFEMMVNSPEYLTVPTLQHLASSAGRLQGLGDYRPTYGRFSVTSFKTSPL
jgi:hypothetical protein